LSLSPGAKPIDDALPLRCAFWKLVLPVTFMLALLADSVRSPLTVTLVSGAVMEVVSSVCPLAKSIVPPVMVPPSRFHDPVAVLRDRKSVVWGKGGGVGGRRLTRAEKVRPAVVTERPRCSDAVGTVMERGVLLQGGLSDNVEG